MAPINCLSALLTIVSADKPLTDSDRLLTDADKPLTGAENLVNNVASQAPVSADCPYAQNWFIHFELV